MDKSRELGMRTFDWALFELYNDGQIGYDEAIRNADSANELRLNIKLKSKRGEPPPSEFMRPVARRDGRSPAELEERRAPGDAEAAGGAAQARGRAARAAAREEAPGRGRGAKGR